MAENEHTAENGLPDEPMSWADLPRILEAISPSSMVAHLDPSRPYDGQPHTDHGERGKTEVRGITFRDLRDCFIRACYESSGLPVEQWPGTVYDLPWDDMDIVAVAQNLSCNVEKAMGIYPNVPRLYPTEPTEPHWCGHPLDAAVHQAHEGHCDDPKKRVIPPGTGDHCDCGAALIEDGAGIHDSDCPASVIPPGKGEAL